MAYLGFDHRPTWEEFNANPVIRTEIDEPYYPFKSALDKGESPFNTPTKKIEFSSNFVKTHDMTESAGAGTSTRCRCGVPAMWRAISEAPPTTALQPEGQTTRCRS